MNPQQSSNAGPELNAVTKTQSNSRRFFYMFAVCLLLTSFRGWDRLAYPGLWAEDGSIHLVGAMKGVPLFSPSEGYAQFLPRLILKIGIWMPFTWMASYICAVCYVIFSATAALFIDDAYEWLVPSMWMRAIFCVLYCFAPGLNEMLGNAANLYNMIFFSLALLGLRNIDRPLGWIAGVWGFVVCASSGATILQLPIFSWRIFTEWRRGARVRALLPTLLIVISTVGFTALNFLAAKSINTRTEFVWHSVWRSYRYIFFAHFISAPLFGPPVFIRIFGDLRRLLFRVSLVAVAAAIVMLRRLQARGAVQLGLFFAAILLMPFLTFIVRPASMKVFDWHSYTSEWFWGNRYTFQVFVAGWVLWFAVLSRAKMPGFKYLNWVLVGLMAGANLYLTQFWIARYGNRDWTEDALDLEQHYRMGQLDDMRPIPVYPWVNH